MENRKLSENFWLSEFDYVEPDPRLLLILQHVRNHTAAPVHITDATRSVSKHIAIYKKLEADKKIKTKGNGLGEHHLIDLIPWDSRHLPMLGSPYLRASDVKCERNDGTLYAGHEIYNIVMKYVNSDEYRDQLEHMRYEHDAKYVGIGIGRTYAHIDVDRKQHTVWEYTY